MENPPSTVYGGLTETTLEHLESLHIQEECKKSASGTNITGISNPSNTFCLTGAMPIMSSTARLFRTTSQATGTFKKNHTINITSSSGVPNLIVQGSFTIVDSTPGRMAQNKLQLNTNPVKSARGVNTGHALPAVSYSGNAKSVNSEFLEGANAGSSIVRPPRSRSTALSKATRPTLQHRQAMSVVPVSRHPQIVPAASVTGAGSPITFIAQNNYVKLSTGVAQMYEQQTAKGSRLPTITVISSIRPIENETMRNVPQATIFNPPARFTYGPSLPQRTAIFIPQPRPVGNQQSGRQIRARHSLQRQPVSNEMHLQIRRGSQSSSIPSLLSATQCQSQSKGPILNNSVVLPYYYTTATAIPQIVRGQNPLVASVQSVVRTPTNIASSLLAVRYSHPSVRKIFTSPKGAGSATQGVCLVIPSTPSQFPINTPNSLNTLPSVRQISFVTRATSTPEVLFTTTRSINNLRPASLTCGIKRPIGLISSESGQQFSSSLVESTASSGSTSSTCLRGTIVSVIHGRKRILRKNGSYTWRMPSGQILAEAVWDSIIFRAKRPRLEILGKKYIYLIVRSMFIVLEQ